MPEKKHGLGEKQYARQVHVLFFTGMSGLASLGLPIRM